MTTILNMIFHSEYDFKLQLIYSDDWLYIKDRPLVDYNCPIVISVVKDMMTYDTLLILKTILIILILSFDLTGFKYFNMFISSTVQFVFHFYFALLHWNHSCIKFNGNSYYYLPCDLSGHIVHYIHIWSLMHLWSAQVILFQNKLLVLNTLLTLFLACKSINSFISMI